MPDRRAVTAALVATAGALAFGEARAGPSSRPAKEVLAFYYGWYGAPKLSGDWLHWQGPTTAGARQSPTLNTPLLGRYDSHDPAVLAQHAQWAKAAGLTGVVSSWWGVGSFEDRSLALLLDAMHGQGLKVAAYMEQQKGGEAGATRDLIHILQTHGKHPAWLKVGDRPVVFLYLQALRDLPASGWRDAAKMAANGGPEPFLIGDDSPREPETFDLWTPSLDGVHVYVLAPYVRGKSPDGMRAWVRATYPKWKAMTGNKLFCATVIPGFDDTKVPGRAPPRPIVPRNGGATFAALWEETIAARPDWVLVTSFNEWHEGSEIEPSAEHGSRYLEANARYARRFLAS